MTKLFLNYMKKDYPDPHDIAHATETWGGIEFYLVDMHGKRRQLLYIEWDIKPLIDWFLTSKLWMLTQGYPIPCESRHSLAKMIYDFYKSDDGDVIFEKYWEDVRNYREHHGLRFGLRGTEINDIYIGKNNDIYEISFYSPEVSWCYEINILEFYNVVEELAIHLRLANGDSGLSITKANHDHFN